MIFRKAERPPAEILQKQREAIVDLLNLCLYADSHITLREGEFLGDVVHTIGWETQSSYGSYEARSIAEARAAKEDPSHRREFLRFARERLDSAESRALAVDLCEQLVRADGTRAEKESELMTDIRTVLK